MKTYTQRIEEAEAYAAKQFPNDPLTQNSYLVGYLSGILKHLDEVATEETNTQAMPHFKSPITNFKSTTP